MHATTAVIQPTRSTLDTLAAWAKAAPISHFDVAAAYATTAGVRALLTSMESNIGPSWLKVQKRWLTSFDYLRSEPLAVQTLVALENSEVRIHDAVRVLRQKGMPVKPFHPKAFMFRGKLGKAALAGSGNLSRSGMSTGFEAGFILESRKPIGAGDKNSRKALQSLEGWFTDLWEHAGPLDPILLKRYAGLYDATKQLSQPTPTEDDAVFLSADSNALTGDDIIKLRVCRHFWIEAGNVTRNRGPALPGNQLMMRRLSRVFFGVPASDVPQNSPLTKISISLDGNVKPDCSLTFSDNGMDKLTLPVPGAAGPAKYDNETLLFRRIGPGKYDLVLGTSALKAAWKARSKAIGAFHSMPQGGREWGVF